MKCPQMGDSFRTGEQQENRPGSFCDIRVCPDHRGRWRSPPMGGASSGLLSGAISSWARRFLPGLLSPQKAEGVDVNAARTQKYGAGRRSV